MRFSQRIGLTPATKVAQREDMDADLRNSLWSLLTLFYWNTCSRSDLVRYSNLKTLITSLWFFYFKQPIDTIDQSWEDCHSRLRDYFFKAKWYEVYDFIEFIANCGPDGQREKFTRVCNYHLERENSAYRFVNGRITEITSQEEIDEVESAIANASPYAGVKAHLTAALAHLSSRTNPDYRNSIKESISAVESLAKKLTQDDSGTLGSILNTLEKSKKLHPALRKAFSSLYGYTSDANGIRHALLEESDLTKADARFMLVCCSAFINYTMDAVAKR